MNIKEHGVGHGRSDVGEHIEIPAVLKPFYGVRAISKNRSTVLVWSLTANSFPLGDIYL